MRASVAAAFPAFTEHFEGRTPYPYLDIKGIVTAACGVAFFTPESLCEARWMIGARPAVRAEILSAWDALQTDAADQIARPLSIKRIAASYASMTSIRLTDDGIAALLDQRAAIAQELLRERFAAWGSSLVPADAELATMSMAWAAGAYGITHAWPKFDAAFARQDWSTCAVECHLDEAGNPGLIARNAANARLFLCAQSVADGQQDPELLTGWP